MGPVGESEADIDFASLFDDLVDGDVCLQAEANGEAANGGQDYTAWSGTFDSFELQGWFFSCGVLRPPFFVN